MKEEKFIYWYSNINKENSTIKDIASFKTACLYKLNIKELPGKNSIYDYRLDTIFICEKDKQTLENYHRVFFHELAHSTSHYTRLKRPISVNFKSYKYAIEELIAETSSLLFSIEFGIYEANREAHYNYLLSWYRIMYLFNRGRSINNTLKYVLNKSIEINNYIKKNCPIL